MVIRKETEADKDCIYDLVKTTLAHGPFAHRDEHNLVNRLRKSDKFMPDLSIVAERDGKVVGYALFSEVKVGQRDLLVLSPFVVASEVQGRGIGNKLIQEGHKIGQAKDYPGCVVNGDERYFARFGYQKAKNYNITPPDNMEEENFLAIEFVKDSLATVYGMVEYPKEFYVN